MGGRTPIDPNQVPVFGASEIWADLWRSSNQGATWDQIVANDAENHWPARAYFQAVRKGDEMFVLGGQNFNVIDNPFPGSPPQLSVSDLCNDVWSSSDGVNWTQMTANAGWEGRAGLSSVVFRDDIYVFGGSKNDDSVIIGPGGPPRIYFNDVWKSSNDGVDWQQVTEVAPWEPRAGAAVLVKNDYIYLLGGGDGFTCDSGAPCPPYYNDVWRTQDGMNWEKVDNAAEWPARPGHQAVVVNDQIVIFGGFGLSTDPMNPFKVSNPMDMWSSQNGADWQLLDQTPWNANSPEDIKYDFDALVAPAGPNGDDGIYTFGGDRETFNPFDPVNYLRVDNDVWTFATVPEPSSGLLMMFGAFLLGSLRKRGQ